MSTRRILGDLTVLAGAFYRVAIHNAEHGVAVEEFEELHEALATVDQALGDRPRTSTVEGDEARFEGTSASGATLRVTLSYYRRATPPDARWREQVQKAWQPKTEPALPTNEDLNRLLARITPVLGADGARQWFKTRNPGLDGETPFAVFYSRGGQARVENLVEALLNGAIP